MEWSLTPTPEITVVMAMGADFCLATSADFRMAFNHSTRLRRWRPR